MMSVEEWTSGMDAKQLRACIARFEDEEKWLRARVAELEAALEFEHEETKRLREIIMPLRARAALWCEPTRSGK